MHTFTTALRPCILLRLAGWLVVRLFGVCCIIGGCGNGPGSLSNFVVLERKSRRKPSVFEVVFQMQSLVNNPPLDSIDVRRCPWDKIIEPNKRDECLPPNS